MAENNHSVGDYGFENIPAYRSANVTPTSSPIPPRLNDDTNGLRRASSLTGIVLPPSGFAGGHHPKQATPVNIEHLQRFASIGVGISTLLLVR